VGIRPPGAHASSSRRGAADQPASERTATVRELQAKI